MTYLATDRPAPLVSVLVCVYNGDRFLAAALDSVLAQSYTDFELIVVDDGSTDRSGAILDGYDDRRVRVIRQPQRGAPAALQAGLADASGAYVSFLDQDDLWMNDKLAAHLELFARQPDLDLTFSWYRIIGESGQEIGVRSNRFRGTIDFRSLLADFVIGATSNVVVRRDAIQRAGGMDPALPRFYDFDLCLRVALLRPHNIQAIPRDLMLYRRHGGQLTCDLAAMRREWEQVLEKMRRLAPRDVARVERESRSNMNRYFACLAYESDQFSKALALVRESFLHSPAHFLADSRNWWTGAACLSGFLLPPGLHRKLERLAGLRRERS